MDNRSLAEMRESAEKRKKAAEEKKANRLKAADPDSAGDTSVLDNLLDELRKGKAVGRQNRHRNRQKQADVPSTDVDEEVAPPTETNEKANETVVLARDMLAALKSDGFATFVPPSPLPDKPFRRSRRHRREKSETLLVEESQSTQSQEVFSEEEQFTPPLGNSPGHGDSSGGEN